MVGSVLGVATFLAVFIVDFFALHRHVFSVLESVAFRAGDLSLHEVQTAFGAHRLQHLDLRHIFLVPHSSTLLCHYLRHLEFGVVTLLVGGVNFVRHVCLKFLQTHIFVLRSAGLSRGLMHEPSEDLFVGVRFSLLVRHVITVGRLFVKLGQTIRSLLEAVFQVLQVNISTRRLGTLVHLMLLGVH